MMELPTDLAESAAERHQPQSASSSSTSCDISVLQQQAYRRMLRHCANAICHSVGFHSVERGSLDVLAVLLLHFFSKTCQSSRAICEHTGRSLVNFGDILMALESAGRPELADFDCFLDSVQHGKSRTINLLPQSPTKEQSVLRISEPRPHPSHFPNFLPHFPEPHTYTRSEVHDVVDTNYERVRRLDAQNKRDWEKSLVHFALTQYPTISVNHDLNYRLLFFEEPRPYLSALLTDDADQIIDDETHNNYFARILSKEMDEDLDDSGVMEEPPQL